VQNHIGNEEPGISTDLNDLIGLLGENVCFSGGAVGADLMWGKVAQAMGHTVIHWSFARHRSNAKPENLFPIPQDDLCIADRDLFKVAKVLHRSFPQHKYTVANLLRRNWFQIRWSDALYAVGKFQSSGQVDGGTAWAVELFRLKYPTRPLYFFNQENKRWYQRLDEWAEVQPPRPFGWYAGIGTRDLNEFGRMAIIDSFV
jgi:hypothetical protein